MSDCRDCATMPSRLRRSSSLSCWSPKPNPPLQPFPNRAPAQPGSGHRQSQRCSDWLALRRLLPVHALGTLAIAVNRVQDQVPHILADRPPIRRRGRLKRRPQRRLNPNRQLLTLARVLSHVRQRRASDIGEQRTAIACTRPQWSNRPHNDRAHPLGSFVSARPKTSARPHSRRAFLVRSPLHTIKKPRQVWVTSTGPSLSNGAPSPGGNWGRRQNVKKVGPLSQPVSLRSYPAGSPAAFVTRWQLWRIN